MRTRAFRPEVSDYLEPRSLLSGIAGVSADPVVLPLHRYNLVAQQIQLGFLLFARDRYVPHLRDEIYDVIVIIPFGRVDGLRESIDRIVTTMHEELAANVPHAIRSAFHDVLAATRAEVKARVQAGDVVVR